MKHSTKKALVVVTTIALIGLLASCNHENKKPETKSEPAVAQMTDKADMNDKTDMMKADKIGYSEYTPEKLAQANGDTVLFFHAGWCSKCRKADENLMKDSIPEGVNILKVDFDSETELRQKYGVTKQHTFVQVNLKGEKIKSWGSSLTADEIVENMEKTMMDKVEVEVMQDKTEEMNDKVEVMEDKMVAGGYSDYSSSKVADYNGNSILFFHATWCPSCRSADKNLSSETIPYGMNILKVDYDGATNLRQKYGVGSQHTFVMVNNKGEKLDIWAGSRSVDDIQKHLSAK